MIESVWQDKTLRYTILFSLYMISQGHTPPQDMADAVAQGLYKYGARTAEDIQAVTEAMALIYASNGVGLPL